MAQHIKPPGTYVTGKRQMVYTVVKAAPYDVAPMVQLTKKPPPTINGKVFTSSFTDLAKTLTERSKEKAVEDNPLIQVPAKIGGGQRYLAMLGGEPKATPKRPQVGKPSIMSFKKHRTIGVAGYSPNMRHGMKREAEQNIRRARKSTMFSSVAEAMASLRKR